MGPSRIISYNAQAASYISRVRKILTILASQILCVQGTKTLPHRLLENVPVHKQFLQGYSVYRWHAGKSSDLSNSSTGVDIAIENKFLHPSALAAVYSPPSDLQGRGGAVWYHKHRCSICVLNLYLPASGTNAYRQLVTEKLLTWADSILQTLPRSTKTYLEANARRRQAILWSSTERTFGATALDPFVRHLFACIGRSCTAPADFISILGCNIPKTPATEIAPRSAEVITISGQCCQSLLLLSRAADRLL
jgi:hypothetical protein